LVVGDIIKRFITTDLSEQKERMISRLSVLILSLFTYLLAVSVSGILKTLLIGLTLTTAYTLLTLMTIFWPKFAAVHMLAGHFWQLWQLWLRG
jgi:SSS family solute:Na+ symporter